METKMKQFKKCQSCGMPLNKDSKKGGINSDGLKNNMYRSYCFGSGFQSIESVLKKFISRDGGYAIVKTSSRFHFSF